MAASTAASPICTTMTAEMRETAARLAQLFAAKTDHLATELAKYKGHVEHVEKENKELRELIADIENKFTFLGNVFGSDSRAQFGSPTLDSPIYSGVAYPRTELPRASNAETDLPLPPPFSASSSSGLTFQQTPFGQIAPVPITNEAGFNGAFRQTMEEEIPSAAVRKESMMVKIASDLKPPMTSDPMMAKPSSFSFVIRKADGVALGAAMFHTDNGKALRVGEIAESGALAAWNRLARDRIVHGGDKIVSVNDITEDAQRMFTECEENSLLRLVIVKGECD